MFLQTTCSVTNFKALFVLFSFLLLLFLHGMSELLFGQGMEDTRASWYSSLYLELHATITFFVVDLQQPCFSYTWSGCRSMFGRMDGCWVGILQLEGWKLFCFEGNVSWQATTPWVLDLLRFFFVVETNDLRSDDGLHVPHAWQFAASFLSFG